MNNQQKVLSYLLFLVWPFGAMLKGIKTFDTRLGRALIVGAISFIGFTAFSEGDLERYEAIYYLNRYQSFVEIINQTLSLQESKFYIQLYLFVFNLLFTSHFFYFAALFATFGYFLVSVIYQFYRLGFSKKTIFTVFFFVALALYYSLRSSLNIPFYTGGLYFLCMLLNYIIKEDKKYLFWACLTPLFHIALGVLVPILLLFYFLKNKIMINIFIVVATFIIGQSSVVGFLGVVASENKGTVVESKYESYASERGQAHLEKRYRVGELNYNWKLKLLNTTRDFLWYIYIPLGMGMLLLKRKEIETHKILFTFLNLVLLLWAVSNLLINISNGNRFMVFFTFIAFGLFYLVYVHCQLSKLFKWYCYLLVLLGLIYGILNLIAFNKVLTLEFFISNFFIQSITYLSTSVY